MEEIYNIEHLIIRAKADMDKIRDYTRYCYHGEKVNALVAIENVYAELEKLNVILNKEGKNDR